MSYLFEPDPLFLQAVKDGALRPSAWSDETLRMIGREFAEAQDALVGPDDSKQIPLPMPNILYLALTIFGRGTPKASNNPWFIFRLLSEIQRDLEGESLNRLLLVSPPFVSRDCAALIEAAERP